MSEFKLQNDPTQGNLFENVKADEKPVTCLGQTFPNDAARRAHFTALLKEYETYKTEKKIKTPRLEVLRVGFQKSYEAHDYAAIVAIAKKLPADVVETDEKLLRYYNRAQLHLED